jgi:hypothetical protein
MRTVRVNGQLQVTGIPPAVSAVVIVMVPAVVPVWKPTEGPGKAACLDPAGIVNATDLPPVANWIDWSSALFTASGAKESVSVPRISVGNVEPISTVTFDCCAGVGASGTPPMTTLERGGSPISSGMLRDAESCGWEASLTLADILNEPDSVDVPDIVPSAPSESPGGSPPPDQLYGGRPPVAASACE